VILLTNGLFEISVVSNDQAGQALRMAETCRINSICTYSFGFASLVGRTRIGKARSILFLALISRNDSSNIFAGLKPGGDERGGNSLNVATNVVTPSIPW